MRCFLRILTGSLLINSKLVGEVLSCNEILTAFWPKWLEFYVLISCSPPLYHVIVRYRCFLPNFLKFELSTFFYVSAVLFMCHT